MNRRAPLFHKKSIAKSHTYKSHDETKRKMKKRAKPKEFTRTYIHLPYHYNENCIDRYKKLKVSDFISMAAAVNCPKHDKNRSNNGNVFSAFLFLFSKIRQFRVQPYHTSPPKKTRRNSDRASCIQQTAIENKGDDDKKHYRGIVLVFLQVSIPVRRSRRTASKQKGVISFFFSPGSEIQAAAAAPLPHIRRNRMGIHTHSPAPH